MGSWRLWWICAGVQIVLYFRALGGGLPGFLLLGFWAAVAFILSDR